MYLVDLPTVVGMNRSPGSASDCSTPTWSRGNWTQCVIGNEVRCVDPLPASLPGQKRRKGHRCVCSRHSVDTGNCTIVAQSGHRDKSRLLTRRAASCGARCLGLRIHPGDPTLLPGQVHLSHSSERGHPELVEGASASVLRPSPSTSSGGAPQDARSDHSVRRYWPHIPKYLCPGPPPDRARQRLPIVIEWLSVRQTIAGETDLFPLIFTEPQRLGLPDAPTCDHEGSRREWQPF